MEVLCPDVGSSGSADGHAACRYHQSSCTSQGLLQKEVFISHTRALRMCLSLSLSLKGILYDKWPINMAMAFFFLFFHSKHWSIDVAAVCCQRFDLLWILQKLNHTEVISIRLKLHLNLPWNSCSMLPRARPFLTVRVFSNRKEIVLKPCSSFWPWSQQYSHVCIVSHF